MLAAVVAIPSTAVARHLNPGICSGGLFCRTKIPEFVERLVLKFRTEADGRKKNSVTFVFISRTNFTRNFVRVLSATVQDFSAVTMQLNPGKGFENKQV